jgi:cytochrome c-type biogenesis protein CcmH/NrfG
MTLKYYLVLAAILVAIVFAAVTLYPEKDVAEQPRTAGSPDPGLTPTKENVSQSVKETIDHLRRLVREDPGNAQNLVHLARMLQDAHNIEEACEYYGKALAIDGDNDSARIDYALCLFEMRKVKAALTQTFAVLRHNPENGQALYNAGAIHANTGSSDSAKAYWRKLVRLQPETELARKAKENIGRLTADGASL